MMLVAIAIGLAAFILVYRAGLYLARLNRDLDEETTRLKEDNAALLRELEKAEKSGRALLEERALGGVKIHVETPDAAMRELERLCNEAREVANRNGEIAEARRSLLEKSGNALCGAAFVQGQLLGGVLRAGIEGQRHAQCPYDDCTCQRGPNYWRCQDLVEQLEVRS
jgi:hypothetical protein